jgi:hypothetical protein
MIRPQDQPVEDNALVLGGERVKAKDEYLNTITNVFYKINAAADGERDLGVLQWRLDYYTDLLIGAILEPMDRDKMITAKENVYYAECLKLAECNPKYRQPKTASELLSMLSKDELHQAKISACSKITGECRTYFDQYFGFVQKLSVMI